MSMRTEHRHHPGFGVHCIALPYVSKHGGGTCFLPVFKQHPAALSIAVHGPLVLRLALRLPTSQLIH